MKQGSKRIGVIATLSALISSLYQQPQPDHSHIQSLQNQKRALILNYGGMIPAKTLNQRQRRKLRRQQPHGK